MSNLKGPNSIAGLRDTISNTPAEKNESPGSLVDSGDAARTELVTPSMGPVLSDRRPAAPIFPLRTAPEDPRPLIEKDKEVREMFKLDKNPVKALQMALQMPKFFKGQSK